MGYYLGGVQIKSPTKLIAKNDDAITTSLSLSGTVGRDWFFDKTNFVLQYDIINKADYDAIVAQYTSYKQSGQPVRFQITDTNKTVDELVHIDISDTGYDIPGEDYLAGFSISLTER